MKSYFHSIANEAAHDATPLQFVSLSDWDNDEVSLLVEDCGYDVSLHRDVFIHRIWDEDDMHDEVDTIEAEDSIAEDFDDAINPPCVFFTDPFNEIEGIDSDTEMDLCNHNDEFLFGRSFLAADDTHEVSESSWSFDTRFEETKRNLQDSMRRSQETRRQLSLQALKVIDAQSRRGSFGAAIKSVEESAIQLQAYLN